MVKEAQNKTGIRRKITLFICVPVLVVSLIAVVVSFFWARALLNRTIGQDFASMSQLLATHMDEAISEQINTVESYLTSPSWQAAVNEQNLRYQGMGAAQIEPFLLGMDKKWIPALDSDPLIREYLDRPVSVRLVALSKTDSSIGEIFFTDRYGGVVASSDKTSDFYQADEGWWKQAYSAGAGKVYVGDILYDDSSGKWVMPLGVPIKNQANEVIGICKAGIEVKSFFGALDNFKFGRSGYAVLINEKGVIVSRQDMPAMQVKFCDEQTLRIFLSQKSKYAIIHGVYREQAGMCASFSRVSLPALLDRGINWYVVVLEPASEVFARLHRFVLLLFLISGVLIFVAIPLGYYLGGKFVQPILALQEATQSIRKGEWGDIESVKTNDEIEQFADSFKEMVIAVKAREDELVKTKFELKNLAKSLEQKVLDRTGELSQTQEATLNILEDLTEAKDKMQKYSDDLESALNIKSDFTSMVSHELRTPLTAIKESIGIVLDKTAGEINAEQAEFLTIAKRNVDRLVRLINEILDFQKLESGKMVFTLQEIDVNELVGEVGKTMRAVAKAKGLLLVEQFDPGIQKIRLDRDKMIQVLTNLINNALKFTERGSITLTTASEASSVKISVRDTGPGIQAEDLDKLFQKFEQLEKGTGRKTGGTGLGLAISKELVEKQGGRIWVESEFGVGTVFHILFSNL